MKRWMSWGAVNVGRMAWAWSEAVLLFLFFLCFFFIRRWAKTQKMRIGKKKRLWIVLTFSWCVFFFSHFYKKKRKRWIDDLNILLKRTGLDYKDDTENNSLYKMSFPLFFFSQLSCKGNFLSLYVKNWSLVLHPKEAQSCYQWIIFIYLSLGQERDAIL